jgi:hypothetical protein
MPIMHDDPQQMTFYQHWSGECTSNFLLAQLNPKTMKKRAKQ